jgi:nucleoside-diphosphate-sugar epimerase
MRALFTGGSSPIGAGVLSCMLDDLRYTEIWGGIHRKDVPLVHPRLRRFKLDLAGEVILAEIPAPLDVAIHFAGVTHARDERSYFEVNFRGTMQIADKARALGCRRFVYVSTRCATEGSGAYGESKLAAEEALQQLDWDELLILRPAEIYGGGGREGIDKFLQLATRYHVVPWLWGNSGLRFAPLQMEDFIRLACAALADNQRGTTVQELCGPEDLDGTLLAWRIARRYWAIPLPLWWPAVSQVLKTLERLGIGLVTSDQVARLVGRKTASSSSRDVLAGGPMRRFLCE